jgi:hypothetical protein
MSSMTDDTNTVFMELLNWRVRIIYSQGIEIIRCTLSYLLTAFPFFWLIVLCPDIQMSNPAPSRLGLTHIFEPLMCGRLVQTSLSVCKWGLGNIHVRARVKLYFRIQSTVLLLLFCSARACQSAALPTHAQQVPMAKAL